MYVTSHTIKNSVMKQIMGKNLPLGDRIPLQFQHEIWANGKVLNVLSYARDKYKNISIINTLAALKSEKLKMFLVVYITNMTQMTVTWLLAQKFYPSHKFTYWLLLSFVLWVKMCFFSEYILDPFHALLIPFIWIF